MVEYSRLSVSMRRRGLGVVVVAVALMAITALAGCSSDPAAGDPDPVVAANHSGSVAPGVDQADSAASGTDQAGSDSPESHADAAPPAGSADQPENACDALMGVNMGLIAIMVKPDLTEADVAAIFDPVQPYLAEIPVDIQEALATLRSLGMKIATGASTHDVIQADNEWTAAQAAFSQGMLAYCVGYAGGAAGAAGG